MNCCDYQCHQGRDCPARVAKVHRRTPAAEPLPPVEWRDYLRHLVRWMLVCLVAQWLAVFFVVLA